MKCDICGLEIGTVKVIWGKDKKQSGKLCDMHRKEVWEAVQPQIKTGICWWSVKLEEK